MSWKSFLIAGILALTALVLAFLSEQSAPPSPAPPSPAPSPAPPSSDPGGVVSAPGGVAAGRDIREIGTVASPAREGVSVPDIVEERLQALPKDGLYIRRHNSFGSAHDASVKDLLEQGILVDQEKITFDDFVGQSTNLLPLVPTDRVVGISFGLAPIPQGQAHHSHATHYLELAIRTEVEPSHEMLPQLLPLPANFIFVVDTSGSMEGEKIDAVKTSLRRIFEELLPEDVIGIIAFNDHASTVLKATPKRLISSDNFAHIAKSIMANGGTDILLGLRYGFDELSRFGKLNTTNQVFLFSDGEPTSGEPNWIAIRNEVATLLRQQPVKLSAFAYGAYAKAGELDRLAGLSGGAFVRASETADIQFELGRQLNRRQGLAAINVQLKLSLGESLTPYRFFGHDLITDPVVRAAVFASVEEAKRRAERELEVRTQPDIVTDEDGMRIFVPDLAFGETYLVALEVAVNPEAPQGSLGTAIVRYVDVPRRRNMEERLDLEASQSIPIGVVIEHALKLATSEVVFQALDDAYAADAVTAKARLQRHVERLAALPQEIRSDRLDDDRVTLRKFVSLLGNLGRPLIQADNARASGVMPTLVLNAFARTNNGFLINVNY